MLKSKLALALPLAIMVMTGCSSSDNRFEPVDAPEVTNSINVTENWSASTGGVGNFFSELEVAFDTKNVYTASRNGLISALTQSNGREVWEKDLSREPENDDKRSARISGGVSINGTNLAVGSENGYVYLLNSANGDIKWRLYLESEVVTRPTFNQSGDKLFVLDTSGNFTCIDVATGKKLWVTGDAPPALRLRSQANPVCIGDEYVLYGNASGQINVVLQSTGATVNQIAVGDAVGSTALDRVSDVSSTPLVLANTLYAASYAGSFIEYDFGTFNYKTRLGYQTSSDLGFDGNSIVLTSDDGTVYCINIADNSQRWANTQLGYRSVTAPVVYGNYAVVGDYEGYIYFMDMKDGSIDYMDRVDSSGIYGASQVQDGNLYVMARDGTLTSLRFADAGATARAKQIEMNNKAYVSVAAQGLTLNHPGVYNSGIYATSSLTAEQLNERRAAIKRAVAQQQAQLDAQRRAYAQAQKARAEYMAKQKAYEEERRRRLSGFGISQGINADIEDSEKQNNKK